MGRMKMHANGAECEALETMDKPDKNFHSSQGMVRIECTGEENCGMETRTRSVEREDDMQAP